MSHSPFELVLGRQPLLPPKVAKQCGMSQLSAYCYAHQREDLLEEAWEALTCATRYMNKNGDRYQREAKYQVGD